MTRDKVNVSIKKTGIEYFYNYKGHAMARFYLGGSGFNLGIKKVESVLKDYEILKDFVAGKFTEDIESLENDEVLRP